VTAADDAEQFHVTVVKVVDLEASYDDPIIWFVHGPSILLPGLAVQFNIGSEAAKTNRSLARLTIKNDGVLFPCYLETRFEKRCPGLLGLVLPLPLFGAVQMLEVHVRGHERQRVGEALRAW